MADAILVINAGSSSVKFALFDPAGDVLRRIVGGAHEQVGVSSTRFTARDASGAVVAREEGDGRLLDQAEAIDHLFRFVASLPGPIRLRGVGHRVVHGGLHFAKPVRVTDEVLAQLDALVPLAPLHQPHNLAAIRHVARLDPGLPQVACFDTAFHRGQPPLAQTFALPQAITQRGVHRYGFHGLSYEYIAQALVHVDPALARGKVVVAHLGNGASMCAIEAGRSIASTMGFTALDGLVMGTRAGTLDPGVILYLMDELRMDARAIERLLYRESGLLGVSGISSDMRTLLASPEANARLAVELFCYRISRELGSLAAALQGLDGIVFTGGIGEHAAEVRTKVMAQGAWLGLQLDAAANAANATCISMRDSRIPAYVVPTDEEGAIARHTRRVLDGR